jgi:hypothetical protein
MDVRVTNAAVESFEEEFVGFRRDAGEFQGSQSCSSDAIALSWDRLVKGL